MPALVRDPLDIRLAMVGMVEGNGHPYSWSAIINGRYDADLMVSCGYPVIPQYLGAQPKSALGIPGARVTHIWCDRRDDADKVSRCTYIDHVLDRPEDAIGAVDAVIIPTDIGGEHVERAKPFVAAGLPLLVDKPMVDSVEGLKQFTLWRDEGAAFSSSSCMRYATEFADLRSRMAEVGEPRYITITMMKSWERYGIHALEAVYGLLPAGGWRGVRHSGTASRNVVHVSHDSGAEVVLLVADDLYGGFGHVSVVGTKGRLDARFADTFTAFKAQLVAFVEYLHTGRPPFPYAETVEQMKIIIAAMRSRDEGGRWVELSEVAS